jgi:hypothetical protein
VIALSGELGRIDQAGTADSLTMGSSLTGAMVRDVIAHARERIAAAGAKTFSGQAPGTETAASECGRSLP